MSPAKTKLGWVKSLREMAFRLRGGVWTLLFLVILLSGHPSRQSILRGLPLVVLGQALRFWAVGCIGRYRGEKVGAEKLTTWGPYAFARNPLYIGNGLIGLGWGSMAGFLPTAIFVVTFVLLYTVLIIPHEESFLSEKFGAEYSRYTERTGRFYPVKWPKGRIAGPFDGRVLWKSERHSLLTTVAGSLLIIARALTG
ncbi:MAG: isoprenylcysteine carboxylmethyltransferase family protein [Synergistaceae bacterium]|jgi:protein-S-isoprenylcysteine O-methyltransferase Ste14|nr:isoprenylcysteine carboxylmethyltransferase family protein [Synergistaceae bacterium]